MNALHPERNTRPLGSYEFGTVMLIALFVAPLAMHLVASLAL